MLWKGMEWSRLEIRNPQNLKLYIYSTYIYTVYLVKLLVDLRVRNSRACVLDKIRFVTCEPVCAPAFFIVTVSETSLRVSETSLRVKKPVYE